MRGVGSLKGNVSEKVIVQEGDLSSGWSFMRGSTVLVCIFVCMLLSGLSDCMAEGLVDWLLIDLLFGCLLIWFSLPVFQ